MNAPLHSAGALAAGPPFAGVPYTAPEHFRLALFGVIAHLIEACGDGDPAEALAAQPFLADYADAIGARLGAVVWTAPAWRAALTTWEDAGRAERLPLARLRAAGLGPLELELLLAVGLPEEDPRFSDLFEQATGRERRPTAGLLLAWWRTGSHTGSHTGSPTGSHTGAADEDRVEAVRRAILRLVRTGLLQVQNPEAPRSEWALTVPDPLWDSLRGAPPELPWLGYTPAADLPGLADYIAPPEVTRACHGLTRLIDERPAQLLVIRGPRGNGRRTLLGTVARTLGQGLLVAEAAALDDAQRWPLLGALAVSLDALPAIALELAPGDSRRLPPLPLHQGPIGIVAGPQGGIQAGDGRALLTLTLPMPDVAARRRHWQTVLPDQPGAILDDLARSVPLTSGSLRRAAVAALGHARLDGRAVIEARDVQLACRGLQGARLETLASRLETRGGLDDLAVDGATREELDTLLARCRHREALAAGFHDGGASSSGVRALFTGPSGTGKTLAARLLAATLGKDLYRIDLAATVNKYLGETEKNLDQAFAAAEELDAILLLDEGDALMTARTDVGSSNDRYANLETNFLLQRIESFNGILVVTTNAAERIDRAFSRRMDVVIPFRPPDEWQRYRILSMHLGDHRIDDALLQEIAARCALTGGQIRNLVGHARLLAMDAGFALAPIHLYGALVREYRKLGAHCPVPRPAAMAG